jgi:hypothetical protein
VQKKSHKTGHPSKPAIFFFIWSQCWPVLKSLSCCRHVYQCLTKTTIYLQGVSYKALKFDYTCNFWTGPTGGFKAAPRPSAFYCPPSPTPQFRNSWIRRTSFQCLTVLLRAETNTKNQYSNIRDYYSIRIRIFVDDI